MCAGRCLVQGMMCCGKWCVVASASLLLGPSECDPGSDDFCSDVVLNEMADFMVERV